LFCAPSVSIEQKKGNHIMANTARAVQAARKILKSARTKVVQHQGPFTLHINLPGSSVPGATDHGYGPLALIVESLLEPGTWIRFHAHTNDEIISWVPGGVMRHNDKTIGELVADKNHLMVMNSGSGFWHEEKTLGSDPHLRMLQIFVRPHTANLEPGIQYGETPEPVVNQWRYLFGPEGSKAPFYVRNDVHFYDIRLDKDADTLLPQAPAGWHTYFYVFTGLVSSDGQSFAEAETGLIQDAEGRLLHANKDSVVVAFLINPDAKVVRLGTVGR
jgi:redox-sensitive bicupin YhaK (pirin superfamily)